MKLSELPTGSKAVIVSVAGRGAFRKRIIEMGFVRGKVITAIRNAPLNDPIEYRIMDYYVSLRREEAALIEVATDTASIDQLRTRTGTLPDADADADIRPANGQHITVALVGNPNCGKTTLFNAISGQNEHTGNYSGVTVGAKEAGIVHRGYRITLADLPGTYSVSAYSPEETFVRDYIVRVEPDIVLNVVDASNIERNLYLSTQLIDMGVRTVTALNIYDELERSGARLDYDLLGKMLGSPMVPTVGAKGRGVTELLDMVVMAYEGTAPCARNVRINYGHAVEAAIDSIERRLAATVTADTNVSHRYMAIKALEGDIGFVTQYLPSESADEVVSFIQRSTASLADTTQSHIHTHTQSFIQRRAARLAEILHADLETFFTDARYGFISGALEETYTPPASTDPRSGRSQRIDRILTNRFVGIPLFLFFIWLMFECTFNLGQYPMDMIEGAVAQLGRLVSRLMDDGPLKDLITDGIIGGVGGVIVFLPNILILFFFISFMEDSGYMARAAFIMDRLMHKMGLHGKSFIPLVMGFGCNVPAIMATRTIEDRNNRMLTMLVNPLMSCSARLPVYLLFCGAFFPQHAGTVIFCIYLTGIVLAVVVSRLFKRLLFSGGDLPFVMELPPYRLPTLRSTLINMWSKARQYLAKMGGTILVASIIVWALGYFPRLPHDVEADPTLTEAQKAEYQQSHSYISAIGRFVEPAIRPLGFDWKMGVSLLTGVAAKEIVISTLSVLYTTDSASDDEHNALVASLRSATVDGVSHFNVANVLSFMVFVLIYSPCIATVVAIRRESASWQGPLASTRRHRLRYLSWHWPVFTVVYLTSLAWLMAWVVYHVALFFV